MAVRRDAERDAGAERREWNGRRPRPPHDAPHGRPPGRLDGRSIWLALLTIVAIGCGTSEPSAPPAATAEPGSPVAPSVDGPPLRLLVIDDPSLARSIDRQWKAMAGGRLELLEKRSEELETLRGELGADVVIYPSGLLGTLVERGWLQAVPEAIAAGEPWRRRDQLEMTRLRETVWGETVYAAPLGAPQLLLAYRTDRLEALGAAPPATWKELLELCGRLRESTAAAPPKDGEPASAIAREVAPIAEPLGPGWGGQMLLARAAAYARHRSQYSTLFDFSTLEPRIDSPPFVRALEELAATAKFATPDALTMAPADAWEAVRTGRSLLAITWPAPNFGAANSESKGDDEAPARPESAGPIGWARCPGAPDVYHFGESRWEMRGDDQPRHVSLLATGGRIGSVTKESKRTSAAFNLLTMLGTAEWHPQVLSRSAGAGPFRESHLAAPAVWADDRLSAGEAAEFGRLVGRIHREDDWLLSPRLPGRAAYLQALDEAVQRTVRGEQAPAESLAEAKQRWEAITDERGRAEQRRAYRRCLGLEK